MQYIEDWLCDLIRNHTFDLYTTYKLFRKALAEIPSVSVIWLKVEDRPKLLCSVVIYLTMPYA